MPPVVRRCDIPCAVCSFLYLAVYFAMRVTLKLPLAYHLFPPPSDPQKSTYLRPIPCYAIATVGVQSLYTGSLESMVSVTAPVSI